jgi:hypothetical protein
MFYQYVASERWCMALKTFYAIEKRTADLLDLQFEDSTKAACAV